MFSRQRIHEILEVAKEDDRTSRVCDIFLVSLISLSIIAVILESVESISSKAAWLFHGFEIISITVFTVEYALRIWSCASNPSYSKPVSGRLRFIVTPLAIIDLLAILPFYMTMVSMDLRFMRAVRLLRIFRIAKLGRYSSSLRLIGRVVKSKAYELSVTLFVMILLLIVASCLMYYAENESQPEVFSSIPASMWWGIETLTTVGYGDVYPITVMGKVIGSLIAILGIGMFALPAGILGGGFMAEWQRSSKIEPEV